jgi:hypothetical protein
MKAELPVVLLVTLATLAPARAQTDTNFWTFQPRLSIGKLLPGSPIEQEQSRYYPAVDFVFVPSAPSIRYQGTTLDLNVRAFPAGVGWIALTLGGGVTWFSRTDHAHDDPVLMADKGIGEQLAPGDFVAFPLSAGIQLVYPETGRSDFMLFAGLQGTANFISGDVPMDQQIKGGFGFSAGFAVKVFELGLRYESFSDMRNLGVYLGFRLNPFEMRPPTENPE